MDCEFGQPCLKPLRTRKTGTVFLQLRVVGRRFLGSCRGGTNPIVGKTLGRGSQNQKRGVSEGRAEVVVRP